MKPEVAELPGSGPGPDCHRLTDFQCPYVRRSDVLWQNLHPADNSWLDRSWRSPRQLGVGRWWGARVWWFSTRLFLVVGPRSLGRRRVTADRGDCAKGGLQVAQFTFSLRWERRGPGEHTRTCTSFPLRSMPPAWCRQTGASSAQL